MVDRHGVRNATGFFQDAFLGFLDKGLVEDPHDLPRTGIVEWTSAISRVRRTVELKDVIRGYEPVKHLFIYLLSRKLRDRHRRDGRDHSAVSDRMKPQNDYNRKTSKGVDFPFPHAVGIAQHQRRKRLSRDLENSEIVRSEERR